jgi:hypothetical protein
VLRVLPAPEAPDPDAGAVSPTGIPGLSAPCEGLGSEPGGNEGSVIIGQDGLSSFKEQLPDSAGSRAHWREQRSVPHFRDTAQHETRGDAQCFGGVGQLEGRRRAGEGGSTACGVLNRASASSWGSLIPAPGSESQHLSQLEVKQRMLDNHRLAFRPSTAMRKMHPGFL